MKQNIYRFCLSAFLYLFFASISTHVLVIPERIITLAVFIPPILGLMWGLPAALGVYFGGLFVIPEINNFFSDESGFVGWILYLVHGFWVFLAGYLPHFIWRKKFFYSKNKNVLLDVYTLKKFLLVMFMTFLVTSIFRALTATSTELEITSTLFGMGKTSVSSYFLACFINDFFIAIFFDLAWFFFLISKGYSFFDTANKSDTKKDNSFLHGVHRTWLVAWIFYCFFPFGLAYIIKYQIYGMDNTETWLYFIAECLSTVDVYLVLMLYLILRYRRSIMLEVVFLVTQTVFFSATVIGFGNSLAMNNIVEDRANDTLHAMSVICRERLHKTFFCVRQAVSTFRLQALNSIESYDRLVGDAEYRKNYLEKMKKDMGFTAVGIDGGISYYLRFIPEIEGSKGGFSMQRQDVRWEGALSPFVERVPIDLAPYSPDDISKVGWYYIPMKSKTATWIEPYADDVTHFYVISYVAPLILDGKFIGVVGMDIDFNFIKQELRRMSIYDYGYVYIMDRNDTVLYHKDQPQGYKFQHNPEFQEIELYLANGMWLGIAKPLSKVYEQRNRNIMHMIVIAIIVAMIISMVSIFIAAKAVKPLSGMTEAAKRIASGDLNVKISYESGNELGILVRSIREMAAKLEVYVYRDKLTGLRNAAAYISRANELDAQKNLVPDLNYGVIIFDANFLKKVNDKYGHEAGNELLRHAAQVIRRVFTNSPVYRIGGDEFAAILDGEDYENRHELLELFDKKVAQEHFKAAGDVLTVSVARGLGVYEHEMDFADVAKQADVAMYNHKSAIKSKFGEDVR